MKVIADPHGLIGVEPVAPLPELAAAHNLSKTCARSLVDREPPRVRYVDATPRLYAARDFAALVERLGPELEARARRIAEAEATAAEHARLRRERREAATKPRQKPPRPTLASAAAKPAPPKQRRPDPPPPRRLGPQVYVMLRRHR